MGIFDLIWVKSSSVSHVGTSHASFDDAVGISDPEDKKIRKRT